MAFRPALPACVPVELSRVMLPDDTNPSGNVHGGTILKLIEQAGTIVATRHCNKDSDGSNPLITALARVDHMDFHQPMYVGEVSQVQAAVTYTSPKSIEVTVDVWAENVVTCERRHTNTATLWYIAVPVGNKTDTQRELKPVPVPQVEGLSEDQLVAGRERYEKQKAQRARSNGSKPPRVVHRFGIQQSGADVEEQHTVLASQSTLANVVLPSDCSVTMHMMGGPLMKMMDSAAGICAVRHCQARAVTACVDAIDFHNPVMNGEVVFVTARMVFTSSKSMEIEVTTEAEGPWSRRRVSNTAYFTFVSLGSDKHATTVPPLKVQSNEEMERFEEGRARYEARKKARREQAQQKS